LDKLVILRRLYSQRLLTARRSHCGCDYEQLHTERYNQ
jgi:hypothetical protein